MRYANGVPSDLVEIIETKAFSRRIDELLGAEDYRLLQWYLVQRPDAGRVVPGSGGIRKLRWRVEGAGKRGGVRVAYYWHVGAAQLFFLYAFGKNEQHNLTPDQIKALRKTVEAEFRS